MCASVCLCVSMCVCVCLHVRVCVSVCLCLCVSLFVSLCVCMCLYVPVRMCHPSPSRSDVMYGILAGYILHYLLQTHRSNFIQRPCMVAARTLRPSLPL